MTSHIDISDQLVTLRSGLSQGEADILKSLLTANGVPCFVPSAHMAGLNYAVRTDLQVRRADARRAEHVLHSVHALPVPRPSAISDDDLWCPTCGSSRLRAVTGKIPTAIPFVRLTVDAHDRWFRCDHCGARFQDRPVRFRGILVATVWALTLGAVTLAVIWLLIWLRI